MDNFHVWFERSGGMTSITRSIEFESDTLPPDEIVYLKQLIDKADFFKQTETSANAANIRDQFAYQLTIHSGDKQKTLKLQEAEIPEQMRSLITYLNRKLRLQR